MATDTRRGMQWVGGLTLSDTINANIRHLPPHYYEVLRVFLVNHDIPSLFCYCPTGAFQCVVVPASRVIPFVRDKYPKLIFHGRLES